MLASEKSRKLRGKKEKLRINGEEQMREIELCHPQGVKSYFHILPAVPFYSTVGYVISLFQSF
jgi:hypothetical protein